jgi:cell division protein FtsN
MSKLDYVTIAIVAICFAAIIFLIVKITQLMNRDQPKLEPNRIEETLGKQEVPDTAKDTYDGTQEEKGTTPEEAATPVPGAGEPGAQTEGSTEEDRFGEEVADEPLADEESPDYKTAGDEELTPRGGQETAQQAESFRAGTATGRYMVFAGSFRYKHNAEAMVRRLKQLGYENARVGYFNKGTYAVAVVGQYADATQARSTVDELENKHKIEARIQEN